MIINPVFIDNSSIPLAEYPRPQFKRDSYYPLNGYFYYDITKGSEKPSFDKKILVPYSPESSLSEVNHVLQKDEVLWYKKSFSLDDGFVKDRVFINIGACDQITEVYLNGNCVGKHYGGYNSFSFEISNYLQDNNELIIKVIDDADTPLYGRGKQKYKNGGIWYTPISGIWQSIWLESVPSEYIDSVEYSISQDRKTLDIKLNNIGSTEDVIVRIIDDDTVVSEGKYKVTDISIDISNLKEWSTSCPEIYKIVFEYGLDTVESYFGKRCFSKKIIGNNVYFALNDKPIFQNGLLDQGYFEDGIYTCKSNRELYSELKSVKELGFNMLRKHIKVEPMIWYYYCDILGILVWQDMVNGGMPYSPLRIVLGAFKALQFDDTNDKKTHRSKESKEVFINEAKETIKQLYNVVSICTWTVFNEGWGQFDSLYVASVLKELDSTRLFDNASGWVDTGKGDYSSKHIYIRKVNMKNDHNRILALTEFGGYSYKYNSENKGKIFGYNVYNSAEKLAEATFNLYNNQVLPMIKKEGLSVAIFTQLTDVEEEINGVFTIDRKLKIDKVIWNLINSSIYETFERRFGNE